MKIAKTLILDTAAFVNKIQLRDLADEFYTIPQVLSEIKDEASREFYLRQRDLLNITVKIPDQESVGFVRAFSKKVGESCVLSETDIQVIALVCMLERQRGRSLREKPMDMKTSNGANSKPRQYVPHPKKESTALEESEASLVEKVDGAVSSIVAPSKREIVKEGQEPSPPVSDQESPIDLADEDDDEGEWITPSNISKKTKNMSPIEEPMKMAQISCITDDFAMHNLLLHLSLSVFTSGLKRITHLKFYVLRCHACYK